ncbi:MAG: YgiQ family radical SAM protein [Bacteroidales bacterium]
MAMQDLSSFLPTSRKEMEALGWEQADIILFTGDAYVDHPSFGAAVIGRILEAEGYQVAIVPQPNWRDDLRDFKKLGPPRLFFGVTSGSMDSMVNHYTANKRLRSDDAYTPGGLAGQRPDYATRVYSNILKKIYPDIPVVLGGIEASLRRFTHYDYWSDKLHTSILISSGADVLVYGMGEKTIVKLAHALENKDHEAFEHIPQIAWLADRKHFKPAAEDIVLHSHESCLREKIHYAENFVQIERESNRVHPQRLVQAVGEQVVVVNPTEELFTEEEMDRIHNLPFTRLPHPRYHNKPAIPAYEMIKFSVNIHRGCFGGCSFCTISAHQGKFVVSRSEESVLREVEKLSLLPDFKGYLSDLGGPSANMYKMKGIDLSICEGCKRPSCIFPNVCKNLDASHDNLLSLYRKVRKLPYIKKAFIGSGIRYDIFLKAQGQKGNKEYAEELIQHHVSGRLKVAPEHTNEAVLTLMRKPGFDSYRQFHALFHSLNRKHNLNQQIIPYFIAAHPGTLREDMEQLAGEIRELNLRPEQVQEFTPTPMTLSTVMYYTGINPYTKKPVYIPKGEERLRQKQYFFWYKPENREVFKQGKSKLRSPKVLESGMSTKKSSKRK